MERQENSIQLFQLQIQDALNNFVESLEFLDRDLRFLIHVFPTLTAEQQNLQLENFRIQFHSMNHSLLAIKLTLQNARRPTQTPPS